MNVKGVKLEVVPLRQERIVIVQVPKEKRVGETGGCEGGTFSFRLQSSYARGCGVK